MQIRLGANREAVGADNSSSTPGLTENPTVPRNATRQFQESLLQVTSVSLRRWMGEDRDYGYHTEQSYL